MKRLWGNNEGWGIMISNCASQAADEQSDTILTEVATRNKRKLQPQRTLPRHLGSDMPVDMNAYTGFIPHTAAHL